ncbi:phenoloxidase-activating enzyme 1-like [Oratosquilla oratoria]|uniref:phenoloxidase-activating enzyme 1-like n=1 Tax=Oratosquilla oratoria TaxID=337810 RepID=UPI003F762E7B
MDLPRWTLALTFLFLQHVCASPGGKVFFPDDPNRPKELSTKTSTSTTTEATMDEAQPSRLLDASKYFRVVEKKEKEVVGAEVGVTNEEGNENSSTVTLEDMPKEMKSRMAVIESTYRSTMIPCMSQVMVLQDRYYYITPEGRNLCYWAMMSPMTGSRLRLSCRMSGQDSGFRHGYYDHYMYYNPYCNNGPMMEVYTNNWVRPMRFCQSDRSIELDSSSNWIFVAYTSGTYWRSNHARVQCSVVAYNSRQGPLPSPSPSPSPSPFPSPSTGFTSVSTQRPITTSTPSLRCSCGQVNTADSRIAGGNETTVNKYPWMAAMVYPTIRTPFCSGSIINSQWVLTAAHCVELARSRDSQVILGEHDLTTDSETDSTQVIDILTTLLHPDFNFDTKVGDIGLVQLARSVDLTSPTAVIRPICLLQTPLDSVTNVPAIIAGWGDDENGTPSSKLRETNVVLYSYDDCQTQFPLQAELGQPENTVCTWARDSDSCSGDSGGPVFSRGSSGFMFQIALISYGPNPCVSSSVPGTNTLVSAYMDWVTNQAGETPVCSP